MTAEDAGTAVRRNENADSEPNGNDLEEVSFEVVAPPKGNVSKDGVAEVCDEDANADVSFLKSGFAHVRTGAVLATAWIQI